MKMRRGHSQGRAADVERLRSKPIATWTATDFAVYFQAQHEVVTGSPCVEPVPTISRNLMSNGLAALQMRATNAGFEFESEEDKRDIFVRFIDWLFQQGWLGVVMSSSMRSETMQTRFLAEEMRRVASEQRDDQASVTLEDPEGAHGFTQYVWPTLVKGGYTRDFVTRWKEVMRAIPDSDPRFAKVQEALALL